MQHVNKGTFSSSREAKKYPGLTRLEPIHKLGNRVKCVGDTVARFLQNVTVFCNYSSQQVFILGWNAIGARMLNPGQNRERSEKG